MRPPRYTEPALLAAAAVAFGLFAEDQRRQAGRPLDLAALDLLAGLVFVAAGAVVYLRRPANRSWWLLMAAGATWFLSTLAGSLNEDLATFGFVTGAWHYLFLAWLLLPSPVTGRQRPRSLPALCRCCARGEDAGATAPTCLRMAPAATV